MIHNTLSAARERGHKLLAVLVDPDKTSRENISTLAAYAKQGKIDVFLWGGSLVNEPRADHYLSILKASIDKPVVLFPGNMYQLNDQADGLLLLSLLSGRNPDLLIGQHVLVAGKIKQLGLATTATGYLLIDGGRPTSVSYMSNTTPIPADKPALASCTALAGQQLGMQAIYMDAGSGALNPISPAMITAVRNEVDLPIIVGGGIRNGLAARKALEAGADMIVVGNALEKDPELLVELAEVFERPATF
ncbi:geranylgeranylglyceryl/heptaprenylglyceryl phosphate synthase [Lewinellaceae bacterium SD302]|nr:geranylgeranylglyceryl/heptaprenylglyceryl phosphate synthase [Lewinellaceae bacterium SD302]